MKTYLLLLITVMVSSSVLSQSLKDSLFKGRLKNPLAEKEAAKKDSIKAEEAKKDSIIAAVSPTTTNSGTTNTGNPVTTTTDPSVTPVEGGAVDNTMPDSLNKTYYAKQKNWKRFIDQQTLILSSQADESRKVKTGEYYLEFDYTIGINGRVKTSNITVSPKNDFILESITDILTRTPVLSPPIYGDGKPRPITAKQQMTILKKK